MNANYHYDKLYGEFGLSPNDAARWVFASGWNSALSEMLTNLERMHLEPEVKGAFALWVQRMMHVDPNEIGSVQ